MELINILIRTSNRPQLFKRCLDSIEGQTYNNIRVIVGFDRKSALRYIPTDKVSEIQVFPNLSKPFFYNIYCNELKQHVRDGWLIWVDDDDYLDSPTVLEDISKHLTNPDEAIICQFRRNQAPKPSNRTMNYKQIARGKIGLPCLILHHSNKNIADIRGDHDYDDYLYIKRISELMPVKFVKQVVVNSPVRGWGKVEGIKSELLNQ